MNNFRIRFLFGIIDYMVFYDTSHLIITSHIKFCYSLNLHMSLEISIAFSLKNNSRYDLLNGIFDKSIFGKGMY